MHNFVFFCASNISIGMVGSKIGGAIFGAQLHPIQRCTQHSSIYKLSNQHIFGATRSSTNIGTAMSEAVGVPQ